MCLKVSSIAQARFLHGTGVSAPRPDFGRPPFTPLLGEAYREGDQWRWREPYLEVEKRP